MVDESAMNQLSGNDFTGQTVIPGTLSPGPDLHCILRANIVYCTYKGGADYGKRKYNKH
jgi:hypothetical protein